MIWKEKNGAMHKSVRSFLIIDSKSASINYYAIEDAAIKNDATFLTKVTSAFNYADLLKVYISLLSKRKHLILIFYEVHKDKKASKRTLAL